MTSAPYRAPETLSVKPMEFYAVRMGASAIVPHGIGNFGAVERMETNGGRL